MPVTRGYMRALYPLLYGLTLPQLPPQFRRPRLYLLYRVLCAASILVATVATGRWLRQYVSSTLIPPAFFERWDHRVSPRIQVVQQVVVGLLTDACLLPFFYLVFMRQEHLQNQVEIVAPARPEVVGETAPGGGDAPGGVRGAGRSSRTSFFFVCKGPPFRTAHWGLGEGWGEGES